MWPSVGGVETHIRSFVASAACWLHVSSNVGRRDTGWGPSTLTGGCVDSALNNPSMHPDVRKLAEELIKIETLGPKHVENRNGVPEAAMATRGRRSKKARI